MKNDSAVRLLGSFVGVNLLLAGVFVALVPHLLATAIGRRIRRAAARGRVLRRVSPAYRRSEA